MEVVLDIVPRREDVLIPASEIESLRGATEALDDINLWLDLQAHT